MVADVPVGQIVLCLPLLRGDVGWRAIVVNIIINEIEKKIGIEVAVEVIEAVTTENDTMLECNAKSEIDISLLVVNQ